jgi:hypothetical protein
MCSSCSKPARIFLKQGGEPIAVDPGVLIGASRKRVGQSARRPRRPDHKARHGLVGVEHRCARIREHGRGCRFAHADGAGQAHDDHGVSPSLNQKLGPAVIILRRRSAKKGFKAWPRLTDQHCQPVCGAPAGPSGGFEQVRAERRIDHVEDQRVIRGWRSDRLERGLASHAQGRWR